MRVLRVYHGGRIPSHRARDRALAAAGHEVVLVVPDTWPDSGSETVLSDEPFRIIELPVTRPGDVSRHAYVDDTAVARTLREVRPDVLDLQAEPVSVAVRQWLKAAPKDLPVVMYTAQNVDKRYPPPFAQYEKAALARVDAIYPCSRQAASVVRGKGFTGPIEVLPLGYEPDLFHPGEQSLDDDELHLGLVGRMEPYKGVLDAVRVLAVVRQLRPARLSLIGDGSEIEPARALAAELGVAAHLDVRPWVDTATLAAAYRSMHVVLIPSVSTSRWVEQFGRVIVEAQASGAVVAGYHSGSIPEVCAGAGVLAAEGDVTGLTHAVHRLLAVPTTYARLRTEGLALCTDRAWDQVVRRQAALYETATTATTSVPAGRAAALDQYGAPAAIAGQLRPFALPVLRDSPAAERLLGSALDTLSNAR